ncbi:MAG: RING finger and WD repeat domain-containing protein 3, partial [Paramarteilia canceri]
NGGCRFIKLLSNFNALITIAPSISNLAPGFGIRLISLLDMKPIQYIPAHKKPVKSLTKISNNLILSVSLDKTAKISDIRSSQPVFIDECDSVPWSSESNSDQSNFFYIGFNNGSIATYDMRKAMTPCFQTDNKKRNAKQTPCIGIQYAPKSVNGPNGVFSAQLSSLSFFSCNDNIVQSECIPLPCEGNISSIDFDMLTQHLLVSKRPDKFSSYTRHELLLVEIFDEENISSDSPPVLIRPHLVHKLNAGSLNTYLNKSYFSKSPMSSDEYCVYAGDEASKS